MGGRGGGGGGGGGKKGGGMGGGAAGAAAAAEVAQPLTPAEEAIKALDALREQVSNESVLNPRPLADAILGKLKGSELDVLIKHYNSTSAKGKTVGRTRENIRELVVGRLSDSLAIRRVVYQPRNPFGQRG